MKSHILRLVSSENSLLNIHRSHLVRWSSGTTSFSSRWWCRCGSSLCKCS